MPVRDTAPRTWRPGGFILLAALWLLVALGAVGLHATMVYQPRQLAAANTLEQTRARAAALAGAEYALSRLRAARLGREEELRAEAASQQAFGDRSLTRGGLLRQSNPNDPWQNPQGLVVEELVLEDLRVRLQLRASGSSLNINSANEDELRRFFSIGLGVDYAHADRLTQAILDWRDEDDIPRLGGAEAEQYIRAGAAVLPSNRPFATVGELRHVMGMTTEILDAARPYLTVSGPPYINVNAAPEPVLLALTWMTPPAAAELIRLQEAGVWINNRRQLVAALPPGTDPRLQAGGGSGVGHSVDFVTAAVEIVAEGWIEGSPVRSRVRYLYAEPGRMIWLEHF